MNPHINIYFFIIYIEVFDCFYVIVLSAYNWLSVTIMLVTVFLLLLYPQQKLHSLQAIHEYIKLFRDIKLLVSLFRFKETYALEIEEYKIRDNHKRIITYSKLKNLTLIS